MRADSEVKWSRAVGKGRIFEAKVVFLKGKQEIVWIKQNAPLSKSTVQNCSFLKSIFRFFLVFSQRGIDLRKFCDFRKNTKK